MANDRPLVVRFQDRWLFPVFRFYSEADLGGEFQTEAEYTAPEVRCLVATGGLEACLDDPEGLHAEATTSGTADGQPIAQPVEFGGQRRSHPRDWRGGGEMTDVEQPQAAGCRARSTPFRHPAYRRLAIALVLATFAGGVWIVGLVWEVIRIGGGPAQLSVVSTASAVGRAAARRCSAASSPTGCRRR